MVHNVLIWFLENYDTDEWTLKHCVTPKQLLNSGNQNVYHYEYEVISGHPDCSWMAYDIDREGRA
jgi:hypothetical protein